MQRRQTVRRLVAVLTAAALLGACLPAEHRSLRPAERQTLEPEKLPSLSAAAEPISLSLLTGKSPTNGNRFEDTLVWRTYEEKTGVRARFDLVPFEHLTDRRNLALNGALGRPPDAFYSARLSTSELAKYGKQGVLIPLEQLIERHAPNVRALMDQYPMIRKGLTMPDGHIYSLPSFYDPSFLSMLIGMPLWVNRDWLEKLGMKEPTTVDELYRYLQGVKRTDLNGNGLQDEVPFSAVGVGGLIDHLKGAWGLGNRGLAHRMVDVDPGTGKLRFIKAEPAYRELLQFVRKLKEEGLLDKELFSIKESALNRKGQEGRLGAMVVPNPETVMRQQRYTGLGALIGPHGDRLYAHVKTPMVHPGAFAVTAANPYPAETMRWIDYFYGEEGARFFFMGLPGKTYVRQADGTLAYTPDITNNPDGLTQDQALARYFTWLGGSYPGYVKRAYFNNSETLPSSLAAAEKAKPYAVEEIWTPFVFTEAETETMETVGSDLQAYTAAMEARLINGDASIDEWDGYLDTLNQLGLALYMQTYEEAYKRYRSS